MRMAILLASVLWNLLLGIYANASPFTPGTWWQYDSADGSEIVFIVVSQEEETTIAQYTNGNYTDYYKVYFDAGNIYLTEHGTTNGNIKRWIPGLLLTPAGKETTQRTHEFQFHNAEQTGTRVVFYNHQFIGNTNVTVPAFRQIISRKYEITYRAESEVATWQLWFVEDVGYLRISGSIFRDGVLQDYKLLELAGYGVLSQN